MPNYWILKSDPDTYGYDHLERDRRTTWDGVSNALALQHIRRMAPDDRVLIYHSGAEKTLVGFAKVVSQPYADPKGNNPKLAVVDLEAAGRLPRTVTLAQIKADPAFADLGLVRQARLSVVPVPAEQWTRLLGMAGTR
jgi:predicted RNA-binding protein with PUA-like domain